MHLKIARNDIKWLFYYSVIAYLAVIFFYETGFVSSFNFLAFSVIIGAFGIFLEKKQKNYTMPFILVIIGFLFALALRIIPYIGNPVPLGYDPGFYKYVFENPFGGAWIKGMYPLGFVVIMHILSYVFTSEILITYFFAVLSASTIFAVYFAVKKMFSKRVAVIAALIYPLSIAQLQTFWFNYYKNVIGIILLLVSYTFFKEKKRFNYEIIIIGTIIAMFHRPALFIFGTSFVIYSLIYYKDKKKALLYIGLIAALGLLVNIDRITTYMLPGLAGLGNSIIDLGGGAGTFFSIKNYFYYMLAFIPFAIIGASKSLDKNRGFLIGAIITFLTVILGLFFHNRLIIYLDIFVIVYSAIGFDILIREKKKFGMTILISFIIIFAVIAAIKSTGLKPLISSSEFKEIQSFNSIIPKDSYIMSTSSYYTPWLKGYVNRGVIAPGMFNLNKMNKKDWQTFWVGINRTNYLNMYKKTIYIYVGERQVPMNFDSDCFNLIINKTGKLYEYICGK